MMGQSMQWETAGDLDVGRADRSGGGAPSLREDGASGMRCRTTRPRRPCSVRRWRPRRPSRIADVIASYDFGRHRRIVDVGGGEGHLLRAVVASAEGVKGVLFDQPAVVERAHGTDERLAFAGGDLFTTPLPAGDLFILHEVLHDWDDAHCAELLGAVRRAMPSGSRLLIIEVELAEDGPRWPKLLDVLMLAVFGARQRTNDEYRALLTASEFEITGQTSTPGGLTLIEAVP